MSIPFKKGSWNLKFTCLSFDHLSNIQKCVEGMIQIKQNKTKTTNIPKAKRYLPSSGNSPGVGSKQNQINKSNPNLLHRLTHGSSVSEAHRKLQMSWSKLKRVLLSVPCFLLSALLPPNLTFTVGSIYLFPSPTSIQL